jgi:hypothetical protein
LDSHRERGIGVQMRTLPTADTTGIPEIDAAYGRYTRRRRAVFA